MNNVMVADSLMNGGRNVLAIHFDDWLDNESENEVTRVWAEGFQTNVQKLLIMSQHVNSKLDQPYMPYSHTRLEEALQYLEHNGQLGIQGGHLFWHANLNIFSAAIIGGNPFVISRAEMMSLLRGSYTSKR